MNFKNLHKQGAKPELHGLLANDEWVALVDKASTGDLDAIFELAEGYFRGTFGQVDVAKAEKWCAYAAKRGHSEAIVLLEEIRG